MTMISLRKRIREHISGYIEDLSDIPEFDVKALEKNWKADNSLSFIYGYVIGNIKGDIIGSLEATFETVMNESMKTEIDEILLEYSPAIKDLIQQKSTIVSRHDY